ncbi:MAG: hypothetical protein FOGNACKC_02901 [Anaerolineae bacterium]|nr:hypothetical protein [Anaerolineae bacterium]
MTVYFHSSFGLNRSHMAGILKRALENPTMKDEDLAKPFNYSAPFAARYRAWLEKTGIVESNLPLKLTPMGKVVWQYDPKLETLTTQWFMHHELTTDSTRVETWHFFIHEFLPTHKAFTRDALTQALMMRLRSHSEKHFGPGSTMTPVISRKLIECYTEPIALSAIGILSGEKNGIFRSLSPEVRGPWLTPEDMTQAYSH